MKVAFLGTGLMGTPMVRRLVDAGHELHLWNRSIAKAEQLSDIATTYTTATEAVKQAEIVICMLADGPVTRLVLDEQGVMAAAPENCLFINMGSVEPDCDIELAKLAATQNKHYLDAPSGCPLNLFLRMQLSYLCLCSN